MRAVDLARVAVGVAAVVRPDPVASLARDHRTAVRRATRLLGARWIAEAVLSTRLSRGHAARLGVGVELTHAASMVLVARLWPDVAGPALVSAAVATGLAGGDALDLRD